jgi:uncharacterized integral membrane protein
MTEQDPLRQQIPTMGPGQTQVPTPPAPKTAEQRRYQARVTIAAIIGVLVIIFAVLNLNNVKVHWLFTTGQTPLIIVIVAAFALGMLGDRLLIRRKQKRRSAAS